MKCHIHIEQEAVDVCSRCGKPVCTDCRGEGTGCPTCLARVPAPADTGEPGRSPALATLLALVPGLGQAYNREYLKALTLLTVIVLLCFGTVFSTPLAFFATCLWLYGMVDAYYRAEAAIRRSPDETGTTSATASWLLIGAGLLLLVHNLTGGLLRAGRLIPVVVIFAGAYLIVSYFRSSEESTP